MVKVNPTPIALGGPEKETLPGLKSFRDYRFGTILRPRRTFDAQITDQRLRRGPAILVGILAYLVYQGVFVIFNR